MPQVKINYITGLISEFCWIILNNPTIFIGDILEFGTGSGHSALIIAASMPNINLTTFDGFVGLPATKKPIIDGWQPGGFKYDYESISKRLGGLDNIRIIKTFMNREQLPATYGITKIAAVNMDFDLYESTLDALWFCDKCEWKSLLVRFDDWGAHDHQDPAVVDEHEKAALNDFLAATKYQCQMIKCPNVASSIHGPKCSLVYIDR